MSYLVLARKWRPQRFEDMTGQDHVVQTLSHAIAQNRVAHAFLFCGPRGVGKTTAARLLAKALNCQTGPTATPCGTCDACKEIAAGNSVDVAEIDGASNNGVENVREIRENAQYLPQRDRHRIYIIDEVHMLSGAAFNALLKTLEEPPPHVKFIFATTEAHKVPDTILSRCQRHNFRRISGRVMIARLREICRAEKVTLTDASLSVIVRQADGGMRDALSLLDQVIASSGDSPSEAEVAEAIGTVEQTIIHDFAKSLIRREPEPLLRRVEEIFNRGLDLKRAMEEVAFYLRHIMVAQATGKPPAELSDLEQQAVESLAREVEAAQVVRLFDIVHGSIWEVSRSPQPRWAMEMVLLKAIHLSPTSSIPDLVTRLEKVVGAPGGRSPPANFRS